MIANTKYKRFFSSYRLDETQSTYDGRIPIFYFVIRNSTVEHFNSNTRQNRMWHRSSNKCFRCRTKRARRLPPPLLVGTHTSNAHARTHLVEYVKFILKCFSLIAGLVFNTHTHILWQWDTRPTFIQFYFDLFLLLLFFFACDAYKWCIVAITSDAGGDCQQRPFIFIILYDLMLHCERTVEECCFGVSYLSARCGVVNLPRLWGDCVFFVAVVGSVSPIELLQFWTWLHCICICLRMRGSC